MHELPDPRNINLFSPQASRSLDAVLEQLYALQTHLRLDVHQHDLQIRREDFVNLCDEVSSRILLGQHALVAQTMLQPSGGYDWDKKGALIYASGPDGWWRGEADLEAGVCEYKNVSWMEGNLIVGIAGEEGIENIGRENVIIVWNPSSLLLGKEKVGIGYALLHQQHAAMHERAKATVLSLIPSRLLRFLCGKGFCHPYTRIIPLSQIDERRHAIIYARSSSRMYWCAANLEENTIFGSNKTDIPPETFTAGSVEERSLLRAILERLHPGHNVYFAHNEGYPRYARMQMLDAMQVLHVRYQTIRKYAEAMAVQRLVRIQPGQTRQT